MKHHLRRYKAPPLAIWYARKRAKILLPLVAMMRGLLRIHAGKLHWRRRKIRMFSWLAANIGTVAVAALILAVVILITVRLISNRRKGRSSCSCGCSGCAMQKQCHKNKWNNTAFCDILLKQRLSSLHKVRFVTDYVRAQSLFNFQLYYTTLFEKALSLCRLVKIGAKIKCTLYLHLLIFKMDCAPLCVRQKQGRSELLSGRQDERNWPYRRKRRRFSPRGESEKRFENKKMRHPSKKMRKLYWQKRCEVI